MSEKQAPYTLHRFSFERSAAVSLPSALLTPFLIAIALSLMVAGLMIAYSHAQPFFAVVANLFSITPERAAQVVTSSFWIFVFAFPSLGGINYLRKNNM